VKAINGVFGITNPDREAQTGHYIWKSPAWCGAAWARRSSPRRIFVFRSL